jgi:hypothetical protein
MRRLPLLLCLPLLLAVPAHATGGFSCSIEDSNLTFEANAVVPHGMGGPFLQLQTSTKITLAEAPADFQQPDLNASLVHHWISGTEFNLLFYKEREGDQPYAHVELTIETDADPEEESTYKGTYTLDLMYMKNPGDSEATIKNVTGSVSCFLE